MIATHPCPICHQPVPNDATVASYPFCSERCRTIDLGNWLDEKYSINGPTPASDDEDDDKAPTKRGS